VLQETLAGFKVCCCASQRLHQARRGVHSCVQAAAAARVNRGRGILDSARNGDDISVLCYLIVDAYGISKTLHRAVWEGNLEICRLLLQCNADTEVENIS
jgi:hypothetical protein